MTKSCSSDTFKDLCAWHGPPGYNFFSSSLYIYIVFEKGFVQRVSSVVSKYNPTSLIRPPRYNDTNFANQTFQLKIYLYSMIVTLLI